MPFINDSDAHTAGDERAGNAAAALDDRTTDWWAKPARDGPRCAPRSPTSGS